MTEDKAKELAESLGTDWCATFDASNKEWYAWNRTAKALVRKNTSGSYTAKIACTSLLAYDPDPKQALRKLEGYAVAQVEEAHHELATAEAYARRVERLVSRLR